MNPQKVLVVGAGGIGCELLKNLVMCGFTNITVIDLDTIDLSNLNRQFLFRQEHIGKSKSIVARESVLKFNPNVNIEAIHSSIYNYSLDFFQQFQICLNALDNLQARRYVNRMCLAAQIPLIESGTRGYLGQVTVHYYPHTSCYDCTEKEIEKKTYPVCTIRSTPSEPIHCIVWAKNYLFSALFGRKEEEDTPTENSENQKELETVKKENREMADLRKELHSGKDVGKKILDKVFNKDIKRLLEMKDLWKSRKEPLLLKEIKAKKPTSSEFDFDQKVWTVQEAIHVFLQSLRLLIEQSKEHELEFDKDDEESLNFVTAASNIRSHLFHIDQKSRFQVKEMAGNIIPAIATTNAIVAGMIVMSAIKVLNG